MTNQEKDIFIRDNLQNLNYLPNGFYKSKYLILVNNDKYLLYSLENYTSNNPSFTSKDSNYGTASINAIVGMSLLFDITYLYDVSYVGLNNCKINLLSEYSLSYSHTIQSGNEQYEKYYYFYYDSNDAIVSQDYYVIYVYSLTGNRPYPISPSKGIAYWQGRGTFTLNSAKNQLISEMGNTKNKQVYDGMRGYIDCITNNKCCLELC